MNSLTYKVALNTVVQTIGKVVVVGTSIVTIGLLTRYLGQKGFGEYTTVMTYLGFFGIVVDLGMYLIVVREIVKEKSKAEEILGNALGLRIVLGILVLGLSPLIAWWFFPYSYLVDWAIGIGALSFFFISLNQILVSVFQIDLQMWKLVLGEVFGRLAILGGTYYFILQKGDLHSFLWANVAGNVVLFVITLLFARKYCRIKPRFEWKSWKPILAETLPLAVVVMLNRIYFNIDTIFLSIFKSQEEVGIYGLPYKILDILISFPSIFAGLVFPAFAKHALENKTELKRVYQKAFDFLLVVALPMFMGLYMLAKPIIHLLGGDDFVDSINLLRILSIAVVFVFFSTLSNNLVIAVQKQKQLMTISLISVVVNVVLNLWLIPKYSYFAAAWITVLTEFIVTILSGWFVWRFVSILPNLKIGMKSIVATLVMGIFLWFFNELNFIVLVMIGSMVYFIVLYLIGGLPREAMEKLLGKKIVEKLGIKN